MPPIRPDTSRLSGTVKDLPGSYKFNKFKIISQIGAEVNLERLFVELNIYEDITSPVITGDVIIGDAIGMYNNLPIVGEETIDLNFESRNDGTPEIKKFSRVFKTYKISAKEHPKQDLTTYRIHFASPEYEENLKTKVSKAYIGKKSSEIVKMLLTEEPPRGLGFSPNSTVSANVENSLFTENLIIPYWSPFEAINWIASRTLPDINGNAANFVFFENRDGYNFVSIESLMKKQAKFTYHRSVAQVNQKIKYTFAVESYKIFDNQDVASNIQNGLYSGNLLVHDILTKSLRTFEYDYLKEFGNTEHAETNPVLSTKSKRNERTYSNYRYYPIHTELFNDMAEQNNRADKWLLKRNSLLQQLLTYRVVIRVKGNTEIQVGDTVNFKLEMRNPSDSSQVVPDKYHSGKFLVTSIKHTLNNEDYHQTIELVKDSYKDKLA